MSDPSVLFEQLERRARWMRAIFYAGIASMVGAAGVLAASILSAVLSRPMPYSELASIGALLAFGTAGLLLGLRLPIHLPTVLLRADVALGLEARLSTLHDIEGKPQQRLVAALIAARLPETPPAPSKAFPLRLREVSLLGAAIAVAIAAIMVADIPKRTEVISEMTGSQTSVSEITEIASNFPGEQPPSDASVMTDPDEDAAGDSSSPGGTETLSLSDILTTIRAASPTIAAPEDTADLDTLGIRPRSELTLEAILRRIEENLRLDDTGTLSPADAAILQAFQESAPSAVAQALEEILKASTPDETLDRVSQLLDDPQLSDTSQNLSLPIEEEGIPQDAQGGVRAAGDSSQLMLDTSANQEGTLVFVETTLPSSESTEGDYAYYLTKGVPIEPPSGSSALSYEQLELSYDQIDSIVSGRTLASDVLDTVKAYFNRIAGGGS